MAGAVAEIADHRSIIERAKAVLIVLNGVDDDATFELLRWRSQATITKLRLLAERLVADCHALSDDEALPSRSVYDKMLMSVQERLVATDRTRTSPGVRG